MTKKYNYVLERLVTLACPKKRFVKKDVTTTFDELEICDLLICRSEEERSEIFELLNARDKEAYKKVADLWKRCLVDTALQQELNKYIQRKNELTDEMELN